jgi:hypothetical protein
VCKTDINTHGVPVRMKENEEGKMEERGEEEED